MHERTQSFCPRFLSVVPSQQWTLKKRSFVSLTKNHLRKEEQWEFERGNVDYILIYGGLSQAAVPEWNVIMRMKATETMSQCHVHIFQSIPVKEL